MIRLQELELVFGHTDGQRTDTGWTDRLDVGNSILDVHIMFFYVCSEFEFFVVPNSRHNECEII